MLRGSLDAVHNGQCYGWASDPDSAGPLDVQVWVDGCLAGTALANRYRADLEQAGLGDGRAAFMIEIPEAMRDGRFHRLEARTSSGELIAVRESMQVVPRLTIGEFDRHAPWIDSPDAAFERELTRRVVAGELNTDTQRQLRFFREHGWLRLEQIIPHATIDKLLADIEMAWRDLPPLQVLNSSISSPVTMREMSGKTDFRSTSVRYLDFHNASEAAAEIMMWPAILQFAELCFGERVAAMQSLLFENGTQQRSHQDFAFVHSLRPACLIGAWVALEDARPDAGPLFYWDRSHRAVPKYEFDDGSVLAEGDGPHVRAFEDYLEDTCREAGLEQLVFTPRKGDVLLWHSALVHGGMPRNDPVLTRKSIVSHYTTQAAYPFDRRSPDSPPLVLQRNGGIYYGWRREGHVENLYPLEARDS